MPDQCCGTSVGVLIRNNQGHLLLIERGWFPVGMAPVAGHVKDEHSSTLSALEAETREEVGLTVTHSKRIFQGRLPNLCASPPATPPGHDWEVYEAKATGTVTPAAGETKGAAFYPMKRVQELAIRTADHAMGKVSKKDFANNPGLEAVWVDILEDLGWISVNADEMQEVRKLYTQPPVQHWRKSQWS